MSPAEPQLKNNALPKLYPMLDWRNPHTPVEGRQYPISVLPSPSTSAPMGVSPLAPQL